MTAKRNWITQQGWRKRTLELLISLSAITASQILGVAAAQDVRSLTVNGASHHIKVLTDVYQDKGGGVADDMSRIVFYRPVNASQDNAATVYVNGMYHASLVAGGYSPVCFKKDATTVGVRQMKLAAGSKDGQDTQTVITTHPSQTTYVRVRENAQDRWILQSVPESEAVRELALTKLQVHTISRVVGAVACASSDKARVQLEGDTLFKFARSDRAALTGQGTGALDNLVQQLDQRYSRIHQLTVIGYADPIGNKQENLKLSDERAKTVLAYLSQKGLRSANVKAQGFGATDLVVPNCGTQPTPEIIACNQPNRRVVIEVSGDRK